MLWTDASGISLGAVLMQYDKQKKLRLVVYVRCVLNKAVCNYSVTHQETLAVVRALWHFCDLIIGCEIHIFIDHAPVIELFKRKNLSGKLAQW